MDCQHCLRTLPAPPKRFCPFCGAPVAPPAGAPSAAPPPAAAQSGGSRKRVCIALGLFAGAWITWGGGPGLPALLALPYFAALVLLVLDTVQPAWFAAHAPGWTRRPLLGRWATAVFALMAALGAGLTFGTLLFTAATAVFAWDAYQRGELGPFDLRRLWQGTRRWLLIGGALASFSFSANWEPWIYAPGFRAYSGTWGGYDHYTWVEGVESRDRTASSSAASPCAPRPSTSG